MLVRQSSPKLCTPLRFARKVSEPEVGFSPFQSPVCEVAKH